MKTRMQRMLYRRFDEQLSPEAEAELQAALAASAELRETERQILALRGLLARQQVHSFKPFFASRVMRRIREAAATREEFFGALAWTFRRVALAGAIAAMLLLAHNLGAEQKISWEAALRLPAADLTIAWKF